MSLQPTRRDLLVAGLGSTFAFGGIADAFVKPRRLRVAAVGVGGKGWSNIEAAAEDADIFALCDIDKNTLARGMDRWNVPYGYADFREMMREQGHRIDAVIVSTPDHTHAPAAAMALRHGKAVYCEKPLARTIHEARVLGDLARKAGVPTQMGNQGTALPNLRRVAALLQMGAFGAVKEVHCWTDRAGGWWPQGVERPASKPVPDHVNWDLWIGPSPFRDYADGYHTFAWRGWWDFGTGAMGDIACHCMNLPFLGLGLKHPLAVQAETSGHNKDSFPNWSVIKYEFGANANRGPVTLTWYDGGKKPPAELVPGRTLGGNGSIIVCEKGTIFSPSEQPNTSEFIGVTGDLPEVKVVGSPGHMRELFEAMRGGRAPGSNFPDISGPLTEMALVGNLAVWANGPRLEWDARRLRVKGTDEYDSLIRPKYRKGWTL